MTDGVHAVVNSMQPSARDPSLDHAVRQADLEQLGDGHDTVLTGGEGGNREVETTAAGTSGLKSTYAVDFSPDARYGAMVRSRGARINASV